MAHQSTAAVRELARLLDDVADAYETRTEIDAVDGLRNVMHLFTSATEHILEADAERPYFTRIVSPVRKFLGDNPDAIYYWARIRGDRSYRIVGRRGGETYTSFTVHARDPRGGALERVTADVNDRALQIDADGRYEIVLSATPHEGNWIPLDADATTIITRHYFARESSAAADPDVHISLRIEPLDDPGPPPRLDDAALAERLRALGAWVRAESIGRRPATSVPSFVSVVPNELPQPASFRATGVEAWGAVDIYYASAKFDLGPNDALIIDGKMPRCAFANVMLWTSNMQTLEYRYRQTSLNNVQLRTSPDGSFRVVVAHEDPGVPNWLDTEGRPNGTIFWRFLLPDEQPAPFTCRVVPLADVRAGNFG
ncbi:MAG TPA: DUF1214 domain-containing protein [Acidimicrobiales bacterium]